MRKMSHYILTHRHCAVFIKRITKYENDVTADCEWSDYGNTCRHPCHMNQLISLENWKWRMRDR
jgi:hypothetical protein